MHRQCTSAGIDFELIVLDDHSTDTAVLHTNRAINHLEHCRMEESPENNGVARTRNLLASMAHGDTLLFLDADVYPTTPRFVSDYLALAATSDVVCGGHTYRTDGVRPLSPLRYR